MLWCKAYLDILNRLGMVQECDGQQSDGGTDVIVANAALHYGAQAKTADRIFMRSLPDVSGDKEELVKFWKSVASVSGSRNC